MLDDDRRVMDSDEHSNGGTSGTEPSREPVVDAQLHASADLPVETLLELMDAVGVDAAMLVQTISAPVESADYLVDMARKHGRFRVVGLAREGMGVVDPSSKDVAGQIARWTAEPEVIGVRVVILNDYDEARLREGVYDPVLRGAEDQDVTLFWFSANLFDQIDRVATEYPQLRLVVDHLGLPPTPTDNPFQHLGGLLSLARHPNVVVKCTGTPALSHEPFPFRDLWPHIRRIVDEFGIERLMWGSDITRCNHPYEEAIGYLRDTSLLSPSDRTAILGGSLRRLFSWPP